MFHRQLVTHIRDRLKVGMSKGSITEDLRSDGWSEEDIKEAFHYSLNPEELKGFSLTRVLHSEVPVVHAVIAIAIVITGAVSLSLLATSLPDPKIVFPGLSGITASAFSYGAQPSLSNPDFFAEVKHKFIDEKATFIEANLSTMLVRVYKDGEVALEVPVQTKGREGSWWETPAGVYKIGSKEADHFSSIGKVHQPWSMAFQGNFFIHGWPYYDNGTPVASTYSGGCIRLSTDDAKKVYDLVKIGTPILVFEKDFESDSYVYNIKTPKVIAPSYLAADLRNNHIITNKASDVEVSIASLTKLMTALVATEYLNLDLVVTVQEEALVKTSKPRLAAGDKYSVYQLLLPLLMESSNEAAESIARFYGRNAFIQKMNEKAQAIGMLHTHFDDPSGMSAKNTSTGDDLFMLAKYIYNNRRFIFNLTSGKTEGNAYGSSQFANLGNFNDFVGNAHFIGGKNGKSEAAKETGLSVFEFPVGEGKRPIVLIILGSEDESAEQATLLNHTVKLLENVE